LEKNPGGKCKMNKKILDALRRFSKLVVTFVLIIVFFSTYNIFLIDTSLEGLRFSLAQTAYAYDIKGIDGLDIVLTRALTNEATAADLSPQDLIALEFVKNIATSGKSYKQLEDVTNSLRQVIKNKENKRGWPLSILDNLNALFNKGIKYLIHLPQYLQEHKGKPLTKDGQELFNKAKEEEKANKLKEAENYYNEFIKKYPDYEKIALIKLRLAYCLQKEREFNKAAAIYREIVKSYPIERESDIAQSLLSLLSQRDKLMARMDVILAKTADLSPKDKVAAQKAYYELGVINSQLLDFEEARKFFKRAKKVMPESDLGAKSLFNAAWAIKQMGDLEKSLAEFKELSKNKRSVLALNSDYQVADIYYKEGRYQEAIDKYLEVANKSKLEGVSALCLFQAGAAYMYELNNDLKANEIFALLAKKYPKSIYAKYLAPGNPVYLFLTYLVPRATRVVAWRAGGLLCLSGYSGKLAKLTVKMDEEALTRSLNAWLREELPDTVGNLYVDIKGAEIKFKDNLATGSGEITMGKYNVYGEAEGKVNITKDGDIDPAITRARLAKIPIHPVLINNPLRGLSQIGKKNFPITLKEVSIKKEEIFAEAYGGKNILERCKKSIREYSGVESEITDLKDAAQKDYYYKFFRERFPESDFSPNPTFTERDLFLDFFTRMYLYSGFKLLETVKDTKLDYERSIRTVGMLGVKEVKFGVNYTAEAINTALSRFVTREFPLLINGEYYFDVKAFEIHFTDSGEINFQGTLSLSSKKESPSFTDLDLKGRAVLSIDKGTGLPIVQFKEASINNISFPVEKLNLVSKRWLSLLRDSNVPLKLKEIRINAAGISLRGRGANDFVSRLFGDPDIFTIFMIREHDLKIAGIEKIKARPLDITDFWAGRGLQELGREGYGK